MSEHVPLPSDPETADSSFCALDPSLDRDPREFRRALAGVVAEAMTGEGAAQDDQVPTDAELAEEKAIAAGWRERRRFSRATPEWIREEGWPEMPRSREEEK